MEDIIVDSAYFTLHIPIYLFLLHTLQNISWFFKLFWSFDSRDFIMICVNLKFFFSHIKFSSFHLDEELFLCLSMINITICAFRKKPNSFLFWVLAPLHLLSQVFKFFPFRLFPYSQEMFSRFHSFQLQFPLATILYSLFSTLPIFETKTILSSSIFLLHIYSWLLD